MKIIDSMLKRFGYVKGYKELWQAAQENMILGGETIRKPYSQSPSVYKAIKAIADNVPQAELVIKDYNTEEEIYPADVVQLLDNPNPTMSRSDFIQAVVGFYVLCGEVIIVKTQGRGNAAGTSKLPVELWPFNPKDFEPEISNGVVVRWKSGATIFDPDEIIHIKDWNPYNRHRGLAPVDVLKNVIAVDYSALLYNKAFFDNNALPPHFLTTEKTLTEDQEKRLIAQFKKNHQGASKAFKLAILQGGLKTDTAASSHKDMEFIEQQRYTREEILGVYRTPKALFNITDDLNYATFVGQMKIFWLYTLAPALRKVEASFNRFLLQPAYPKYYCQFDYSNVPAFQEDYKEKIEVALKLSQLGFTANEINEKLELGFDAKPWRDYHWIPFSMVPAGEAPQRDLSVDEGKTIHKEVKLTDRAVWKRFEVLHSGVEVKFSSSMKRFFFEQRKRVLENLDLENKSKKDVALTINWSAENDELIKRAMPYLTEAIESGKSFATSILGDIMIDQSIVDMKLRSFLIMKSRRLQFVNDTTRRQLEDEIRRYQEEVASGLVQGESIQSLSDRIKRVYNVSSSRSAAIARTETTGALNGSSQLYYEEAGATKKQWVVADSEARDAHLALDGEIRDINKPFSNGLMFPGDDGPAEEVVNCRCTEIPIIE